MTINPLNSHLAGIQRQGAAMDKAAEKIARASLRPEQGATSKAGPAEAEESRMDQGLVEAMVAKRMFTAAVRMAQSANEGISEALRIGGYGVAA
ncbi:MAG: hypothetical protein IPK85_23545 [Gemmatimonadetes bacterium]|nr:hypothetical protein [Gemmatimonadota bacterium]